ncbi:MAG: hypothetical protein H6Q14_1419 [Bacteroidetes bacterium]|jgi:hypothetical protein|nr:hypothetical protein [Bacteroidota bacterium]
MIRKRNTLIKNLPSIVLGMTLIVGALSCSEDHDVTNPSETGQSSLRIQFGGYTEGDNSTLKSGTIGSTIIDTYIQPLNSEVALVATLETAASSITRTTKAFATGTKIRVIAVNEGTTNYVSRGDFTVGGSDSDANFHLPVDKTYDFYFISYNRTDSLPSDTVPPFENIKMGENDFLFAKVTKTITTTDYTLMNVTLEQMLTRVALKVDASADGITINSIGTGTKFAQSYMYATVGTGGALSSGAGSVTTSFPWTLNASSTPGLAVTDTSKTVYVPDSVSGATAAQASLAYHNFYVFIDEIAFADTTWTGLTAYFNRNLKQGVRYTVNVTLARTAFAGSNIYWNGTRPAFEDKGTTTNEQYQGLLFKWGSLYGISPSGAQNSEFVADTTPVYAPNSSGSSWNATTASSWAGIPYISTSGTNNKTVNYIYANVSDNASAGTGDICRFLASQGYSPNSSYNWRMPTSRELLYVEAGSGNSWESTATYGWSKVGSTWTEISPTNTTGTYSVANGVEKLAAFFPASGMRGTDGAVYYAAGQRGYYWTGSTNGTAYQAYSFYFSSTEFGTAQAYRSAALPVRCVRIKKTV